MSKKIEKLSSLLNKTLASHGLTTRLKEYRVVGRWEKIVGKVIARHAQPSSLRGKKLSVVVDSSAWMQQLSLLKPEIINKVNESLGRETITDITLRLGEIATRDKPRMEPTALKVLDMGEREKIETYVRVISDTDTRDALRRVIEKDFLSRKNMRKK
jgi:hypothetical protein